MSQQYNFNIYRWQIAQKILAVGIVISLISSFGRADYNLPLFIFCAFLWEFEKFHTRIVYLLLFSFIIDFVYAIYWYTKWKDVGQLFLLQHIILIMAIIAMVIKIIVSIYGILNNNEVKNSLNFGALKENLINFLKFQNTGDD